MTYSEKLQCQNVPCVLRYHVPNFHKFPERKWWSDWTIRRSTVWYNEKQPEEEILVPRNANIEQANNISNEIEIERLIIE